MINMRCDESETCNALEVGWRGGEIGRRRNNEGVEGRVGYPDIEQRTLKRGALVTACRKEGQACGEVSLRSSFRDTTRWGPVPH